VILIALDQVKVGGDIVRQSFLVILGGVVFAFALAFGLGGKDWAAERIESWWPRERKFEDAAKDAAKGVIKDAAQDKLRRDRTTWP
jgi:hypothetical protein